MFYDEGLLSAYEQHLKEGKKILDDRIRELEEERETAMKIKPLDQRTSSASRPS